MQLYDLKNSPFAARVRIQIRYKNLPIEITDAPFVLRTPEFKQAFTLGKLPVLKLDDGQQLAESTVILEYLEDRFPEIPLIPSNALAKAQNNTLIRYTDNHLPTGLMPLFMALYADAEAQKNLQYDALHSELEKLERLLNELPAFSARSLQTGDICLVTNLYFALDLYERFAQQDLFENYPLIKAWWAWVHQFDAVTQEMSVLTQAHQAFVNNLQGA